MVDEDRELIRRILLGDDTASTEFARIWYPRLRSVIREFRSLSVADVDDFLQETFMKIAKDGFRALTNWHGLDDENGPELSAYLNTIARNTVRNYLRRPVPNYAHGVEPADIIDEAESDTDLAEIVRLVEKALRHYSEIDRQVILGHLRGQTYQAIAAETVITPNYVGVKLARVKRRLQDELPELLDRY